MSGTPHTATAFRENDPMKTIAEIRLDNLLLVQSQFKTVAEFAELADVSSVYLSQIKARAPDNKTGRPKQMGDKVARKIEVAIKVPLGWMDMQHGENNGYKPSENSRLNMLLADRIRMVLDKIEGPERGKQARLAEIADCGRATVNHWLNGQPTIQYHHADAIAQHFGLRLKWLMEGTEPINSVDNNDNLSSSDAPHVPSAMVEPQHPLKTGELFLMYVDPNELRLLTSYRKNPNFQPIFDSIAQVITEKP